MRRPGTPAASRARNTSAGPHPAGTFSRSAFDFGRYPAWLKKCVGRSNTSSRPTCSGADQSDFYSFVVPARQQMTLEVTKLNPQGFISMFWYNSAGVLVVNRTQNNGDVMSQTATVDPGTYYMEVRAQPGVSAYNFIFRTP